MKILALIIFLIAMGKGVDPKQWTTKDACISRCIFDRNVIGVAGLVGAYDICNDLCNLDPNLSMNPNDKPKYRVAIKTKKGRNIDIFL